MQFFMRQSGKFWRHQLRDLFRRLTGGSNPTLGSCDPSPQLECCGDDARDGWLESKGSERRGR